jgi:hypothetical protein
MSAPYPEAHLDRRPGVHQDVHPARAELPRALVADYSVGEFERARVPDRLWPPLAGRKNGLRGLDVFDVEREDCPIEMRRLV